MNQPNAITPESLIQHTGWVRSLARRLITDQSQVDDVVQQVWLAALTRPPSEPERLRGWLGTVTRNVILKQHRESSRRQRREQAAARPEPLPSTLEAVQELATHRGVVDAVLNLDEPYRTAIVLRYYHQWKPARIAREQDLPVRTVETRLRRALARLQEDLDREYGGDRRSWALALVPLAMAPQGTVAATASWLSALLMTGKVQALLAASLLTLVASSWWLWRSVDPGPPPTIATVPAPLAEDPPALEVEDPIVDTTSALPRRDLEAPTPPSATCTLAITSASQRPVVGARVVLFRGEEILASDTTDAEGQLPVQPFPLPADLLIHPVDEYPYRHTMTRGSGYCAVELPPRQTVSGRVQVDDGDPHRPLSITLTSATALPPLPSLPAAVWHEMKYRGEGALSLRKDTDTEGRFAFAGLPDEWHGHLRLSNRYVHDPARGITLEAPRQGIEWRVGYLPAIRGRVLDAEGLAVGNCMVHCEGQTARGGFSTGDRTASDGRFRISLRVTDIEASTLTITTDQGIEQTLTLDQVPDTGLDVGDVQLAPSRSLTVEVTDSQGQPLPDALAFWGTVYFENQQRTDAQGRATFALSTEPQVFHVGAYGHEVQTHELPAGVRDLSLQFSLAPATVLEIELAGVEGLAHNLGVQVESPRLREGELWRWLHHRTLLGATEEEGFGGEGLVFRPDDEGRVVVLDLAAGDPVVVQVLDADRKELNRAEFRLQTGEHKVLTMDVATDFRRFRGRVVDELGQPIRGALVQVVHDGTTGARAQTLPGGEFELEGLSGETCDLKVNAHGQATMYFKQVPVPRDEQRVDLRLPTGHAVDVTVIETSGRRLPFARVWAERSDRTPEHRVETWVASRRDGRFTLAGLPDIPLTLKAKIGASTFETPLSATAGPVTLTVPDHGQVKVQWELSLVTLQQTEGVHLSAVHLVPTGDEGLQVVENVMRIPARDHGDCEFAAVVPGQYMIVLEYWDEHTEEEHQEQAEPLLDVRAGATVEVRVPSN